MDSLIYLGILVIGYVAGAISASYLFKSNPRTNLAGNDAEMAELNARLEERDTLVHDLRQAVAAERERSETLEKDLREESTHRTVAETQASLHEERARALDAALAAAQSTAAQATAQAASLAQQQLAATPATFAPSTPAGPTAEEIIKPLEEKIAALNHARAEEHQSLNRQLGALLGVQVQLQEETAKLSRSLRTPVIRGRWGEFQLRRVVELAGMGEHTQFQPSDGSVHPEAIVRLPNRRVIAVDARVPVKHWMESLEAADDASRSTKVAEHAAQVRAHVEHLCSTSYWEQFQTPPDFVVAFLPGENFLCAALEHDAALLEDGASRKVLLATPTTLIALLKAVAHGWRQDKLSENAEAVTKLGQAIYDRLGQLAGHFHEMRHCLEMSVQAYNRASGTLEGRVLVTARRLNDLAGTSQEEIAPPRPVEQQPVDLLQLVGATEHKPATENVTA